jgi:hypothetical protein
VAFEGSEIRRKRERERERERESGGGRERNKKQREILELQLIYWGMKSEHPFDSCSSSHSFLQLLKPASAAVIAVVTTVVDLFDDQKERTT